MTFVEAGIKVVHSNLAVTEYLLQFADRDSDRQVHVIVVCKQTAE